MMGSHMKIPDDMLHAHMSEHSIGADILHATVSVGEDGERSLIVAIHGAMSEQGPLAELLCMTDATGLMLGTVHTHANDRRAKRHLRRAVRNLDRAFRRLARDLP